MSSVAAINDCVDAIIAEIDRACSQEKKSRSFMSNCGDSSEENMLNIDLENTMHTAADVSQSIDNTISCLQAYMEKLFTQVRKVMTSNYTQLPRNVQEEHKVCDKRLSTIKDCQTLVRQKNDEVQTEIIKLRDENMRLQNDFERVTADLDFLVEKNQMEEKCITEIDAQITVNEKQSRHFELECEILEERLRRLHEVALTERNKMQAEERMEKENAALLRRDVQEAKAHGVYLLRQTSTSQQELVSLTKRYESLQMRASEHSALLNEATENATKLRTELRLNRSEARRLEEAMNVIRPQLEPENGGLMKQETDVASARLRAQLQELSDKSALLQSLNDRITNATDRRTKSLEEIRRKTEMIERLAVVKEGLVTEVAKAVERLQNATQRRKKAFDRLTDTRERLSQEERQAKSELSQIRMTCDEESRLIVQIRAQTQKYTENLRNNRQLAKLKYSKLQTQLDAVEKDASVSEGLLLSTQAEVDELASTNGDLRKDIEKIERDWTAEHKVLLEKAVDLNYQVESAKQDAASLLTSLKTLQSDKETLAAHIAELAQEAQAAVKVYWTREEKNAALREEERSILFECLALTNKTEVLNVTTQAKTSQLSGAWADFQNVLGKRQTVLDRICSKREQSLAENMQLADIFTDDEGQIFGQLDGLNEELREVSDVKRKLVLLNDASLMLEGSSFQRQMDTGRQGVATNQEFARYRGILEYVSDWMHRVYERFRLAPNS